MTPTSFELTLPVVVQDREALIAHAQAVYARETNDGEAWAPADLGSALMEGMMGNQAVAHGVQYEEATWSEDLDPHTNCPRVTLCVRVTVYEAERLVAYARKRYAECWGDDEWQPENLAEAVYEALVASNEMPSPDLYGIELDCTADDVRAVTTA